MEVGQHGKEIKWNFQVSARPEIEGTALAGDPYETVMVAANSISRGLDDKAAAGSSRAYYIDRIRVVLIALVVLHHSAITYGAPGVGITANCRQQFR